MPFQAAASAASSVILSAEPQLLTSDLAAAVEFYQSKLGFALVFSYGESPFYAQVGRDGSRLNLRLIPHLLDAVAVRNSGPDVLSATLVVDEVNPLFLEFQSAGVDFAQSLRSEPWGARTFIVRESRWKSTLFCWRDVLTTAAAARQVNWGSAPHLFFRDRG